MIAVTLLSFIILGLMAMFSQTQRAFRLGMSQTDVLESGRVATDLLVRELEQITPSYLDQTNLNSPSFYVSLPTYSAVPLRLPGPAGDDRTNVFNDLYFLTRENQTWSGIGYYVRNGPWYGAGMGPVGALYRIQIDNSLRQFVADSNPLPTAYFNNTNNVSKLIDGVVHFRVRAFDINGRWIAPPFGATATPYYWTNNIIANPPLARAPEDISRYTFYSNAVPAYVELEIGVLEQQIFERYKSIPVAAAQEAYLQKQVGHIQLFRQRIPIRNVDKSAYQ